MNFHGMTSRADLAGGEKKIEAFLTHLAVDSHVAPATQNQAMNALVFLYKKVLKVALDDGINAVRAAKKINLPVVMTREEVAKVMALIEVTPQLVVNLLYGSGLRIAEALRLRVHDIEFEMKSLTVRSGKGAKDRLTTFPVSVIPLLKNHLAKVKVIHEADLVQGYGEVLPAISCSGAPTSAPSRRSWAITTSPPP